MRPPMRPPMRELLETPPALVDAGRVQFGSYAAAIADANLIDARPWALPVPRALRAMRLKEWQAFQFGNEQWFFLVALFDAKFMALAQLKAYDRTQRRKYVFERQLPSWTMQAPRTLLNSSMSYAGRGAAIRFDNQLAREQITVTLELPAEAERPAISGALTLRSSGCEPEVVCIPFAENRGMYSHKCWLAPEGELQIGEQRVSFDPNESFAFIDDHKGYYPRIMRWDWITAAGRDAAGRRLGLNLTRNDSIDPDRYNENCLWIDGRIHLLPPVQFRRCPDRSPEVWELRDADGQVEVDFEIELDGHVRVNALVIESRYRGPFGRVRGHVQTAAGERVELDGLFGMGEDFWLKC